MSIPPYIDHNIKSAVAAGLRRAGIDCVTAIENRSHAAHDPTLLVRATEMNRVLLTGDADFLGICR